MRSTARPDPKNGSGSSASRSFAIAGAGLLGRVLAWRLLRLGHRVRLIDRESPWGEGAAGRVAAAMLAPFSEAAIAEREIFDAGLAALPVWPLWLEQLALDDPTGRHVDIQLRGSVAVAHAADAPNLVHFHNSLASKLPDHRQAIQRLDGDALAALEPELAPTFNRGLFLAGEGCLDNWGLFDSLARTIPALGGEWLTEVEIDRVDPSVITAADGRRFEADVAIDCRGFGAKPQSEGLRGVRGEVLWVRAPEVRLQRPVRLMHPRYHLYIAPKPDSVYVIGATEIESESRAPITVRSGLELQSALYSMHTGFAEAHVLRAYANLRPAFTDNRPRAMLGSGLWRVNGLFRHGYLLTPALVSAVLAQGLPAARMDAVEADAARGAAAWVGLDQPPRDRTRERA